MKITKTTTWLWDRMRIGKRALVADVFGDCPKTEFQLGIALVQEILFSST